jgi:hypothetical protein
MGAIPQVPVGDAFIIPRVWAQGPVVAKPENLGQGVLEELGAGREAADV